MKDYGSGYLWWSYAKIIVAFFVVGQLKIELLDIWILPRHLNIIKNLKNLKVRSKLENLHGNKLSGKKSMVQVSPLK